MTTTTVYTGTERYLAPELLTADVAVPTTESDVYALGCIGLEVCQIVSHRLVPDHSYSI
jgi:serine/threonine protein kinase